MIRLREYIPQKTDDGQSVRTVPIGNSLAPWRTWLEEDSPRKGVDRLLDRFELFNRGLIADIGVRAAHGLVRSWRRF